MRPKSSHKRLHSGGFAILDNLVALLLLMLVMTAASRHLIATFHLNASNRSDTSVLADVMAEIDEYRDQPYRDFVFSIWTPGAPILDGYTETFERQSMGGRAAVRTIFTAQSTTASLLPEAVHIRVEVVSRRGQFGLKTTEYETVIAYTG